MAKASERKKGLMYIIVAILLGVIWGYIIAPMLLGGSVLFGASIATGVVAGAMVTTIITIGWIVGVVAVIMFIYGLYLLATNM